MPQEDQRDFKEVADEVDSKRKAGWTLVEQRWRKEAEKKRKKKGQPKAKAKVKAGKFAVRSKKRKEPEPSLPAVADASEYHAGEFTDGAAEFSDGPVLPGDAAQAEPDSAQVVARDIPDEMTLQELKDLVCQNQAVEAAAEVHAEAAAEVPAEAAAEVPAEAAAEVPAEAAAEVPAEAAAEVAAEAAAEVPAEGAAEVPVPVRAAQPRAARRAEILDWMNVKCLYCHSICGQIKYDPNPGNREPIWVMRVKEQNGQWPSQGKNFRRRLTRLIGENDESAIKWCRSQRTCCQTNKRVDFPGG